MSHLLILTQELSIITHVSTAIGAPQTLEVWDPIWSKDIQRKLKFSNVTTAQGNSSKRAPGTDTKHYVGWKRLVPFARELTQT